MPSQTEQQLADITDLLSQPVTTEAPLAEGEQAEMSIDLSQVVAEQNSINPELNTIGDISQLTLSPGLEQPSNVVNLEVEPGKPSATKQAAADKVTKKAQKDAEKAAKAEAKLAEKAKKDAEKAEKDAAKAAVQAAKDAEKAAKSEPKEKVARIEQNGVKSPSENTSAKAIWALITELSQAKGALVTAAEIHAAVSKGKGAEGSEFVPYSYLTKAGVEVKINSGNLNPEFWAYKKFHGLTSIKETAEK